MTSSSRSLRSRTSKASRNSQRCGDTGRGKCPRPRPVNRKVNDGQDRAHALGWDTAYKCLVDTVLLQVVAHGAPSGHRVTLLSNSLTRCWHSYLPCLRLSSFASHSLTLFSYQIGPIAS